MQFKNDGKNPVQKPSHTSLEVLAQAELDSANYFKSQSENFVSELKKLVSIPSISFDGYDPQQVVRSAEKVASQMKSAGLENVEILHLPGTHPYVYGERLKAPGAPTLLLYAHHDVQPVGREELWESPPFEATVRPGPGGDRLYGRGTADDKAGVWVHLAAIQSYLQSGHELPVNVKVLIEGEEEIGSSHLPEFLKKYRSRLDADILVLTDTANFDCGVPALTVALRGLVSIEVELKALNKTIHSGLWGGPVPDPAMALSKVLSTLVDEQGHIAVPGVMDGVPPIQEHESAGFKKIPVTEKTFREQCGLIEGAQLISPDFPPAQRGCSREQWGINPLVQTWRLPSLTVNAIQASSRKSPGNIINDAAWAKVTVRVVEGMNPHEVTRQIQDHLRAHVPWGLEISLRADAPGEGWATASHTEVFRAADRALQKGYQKEPLHLGCGGSIPFVRPLSEALGAAPALLIGVEDPYTNAHGENESLLLSDFHKACLGQIFLFAELSRSRLHT